MFARPVLRGPALRPQAARGVPLGLRVRLAVARHRRLVVAALLGLAVATALQSLRPQAPPMTQVIVAARNLPAGHRLTGDDLLARAWPDGAAPAGLLPRPQGRVLAAPVRSGEPLTDARVAPAGQSAAGAFGSLPGGWVAVTVRLTDPAAALLVSPGDRVQVIAGAALDAVTGGAGGPGQVVASDALVLAAPAAGAGSADGNAFAGDGGASGSRGGGLLGSLARDGPPPQDAETSGALPPGVLALGVRPGDALDLAAATGVRALTVARQFSTSS